MSCGLSSGRFGCSSVAGGMTAGSIIPRYVPMAALGGLWPAWLWVSMSRWRGASSPSTVTSKEKLVKYAFPCTTALTTPPPVLWAASLPVDLARNEDFLAIGFPSMVTDDAPPCRSAPWAMFGSGIGTGPAGGVGGQRFTSGKQMVLDRKSVV